MRKRALRFLALIAMVYAVYAGLMVSAHRAYIYPFSQRDAALVGWQRIPVQPRDADGAGLYAAPGGSAPTVLFFMGNAGSLAHFGPWIDQHLDAGRKVVAMAYRGGGGEAGAATEARLKSDALAVYDRVARDGPVLLHGYSLGTGLALHVAARRPVAGVILEAPYARLCNLMRRAAWLPACLMPVDRWDSLADAAGIMAPVLVLHAEDDARIPIAEAEELVAALARNGAPVEFERFARGGHQDLPGTARYGVRIRDFVARAAGQAP